MPVTRRHWIRSTITAACAAGAIPCTGQDAGEAQAVARLTGSWYTTSAVNSVILSIEPGGEALVVLLENGAFNIGTRKWLGMPGGLMVEGVPRVRLWVDDRSNVCRAEMDIPAGLEVSAGWQKFPRAFYMSRVARDLRTLGRDRPVLRGWESNTPPADWDSRAGKRMP